MVEGDEAYISVELEGVSPAASIPGTYDCRYVHFQIPGRGWVLVFENLHLTIRVVDGPPATARGKGQGCSVLGSWDNRTSKKRRLGEVRRITPSMHSASRGRSGPYRVLLSLLVSNLSRISSNAPGPMRAPPEKGYSMAPTVNKTSPITAARIITISLCAHVLSRPNR